MKKQTAVEYLIQEIKNDVFVHSKSTKEWNHIFKQALAMEWEQLIEAHADGQYLNSVSLTKRMCLDNAESYFNETYGGDK
jgi:hypothetical protein